MRWITISQYCKVYTSAIDAKSCMRSDGYSLCKVIIDAVVIYELWKLPTQELIGRFDNYDDAKSKIKHLLEH